MEAAGRARTPISRNAVVTRIVKLAMIEMSIEGAHVTTGAIGEFLRRWDKQYGLMPEGVAALTKIEIISLNALFN
jgi:hypothetical protein